MEATFSSETLVGFQRTTQCYIPKDSTLDNQYRVLYYIAQFRSSEVLCASVLVKSGLENRHYGRRGSAALTMRHPSIRKSWH
jgi:hypothetical protein